VNNGEVKVHDALRGLDISVLTPGQHNDLQFAMNESGNLADGIEPVMLLLRTSLPREAPLVPPNRPSAPPHPVLFVRTRISVSVFKSASVVPIAVAPDRPTTIGCSR